MLFAGEDARGAALGVGALLHLPSNTSAMSQSAEATNPFAYEHETTATHAASQDHVCHHLPAASPAAALPGTGPSPSRTHGATTGRQEGEAVPAAAPPAHPFSPRTPPFFRTGWDPPVPTPRAPRCCRAHPGAELDHLLQVRGWVGWRQRPGKAPGMQCFESPVLFPLWLNKHSTWVACDSRAPFQSATGAASAEKASN